MSRKTDASSPSGAGLRMVTGTYTGDGNATLAVIGVGFTPKTVMVFGTQASVPGSLPMGYKTDIDGLNAGWMKQSDANNYLTDEIISLDADGFTVGDGTDDVWNTFNINTQIYHYIAWG